MNVVRFDTTSGVLIVERKADIYEMSFPIITPEKIEITDDIIKALGFVPTELYSQRDLYAVVDSEEVVLNYSPDYDKLSKLDKWMGIAICYGILNL